MTPEILGMRENHSGRTHQARHCRALRDHVQGQAGPAGSGQPQQAPGGDILGQILRDILGGAGGQVQLPRQALMGGVGAAVFGIGLRPVAVSSRATSTALEVFNRFAGGSMMASSIGVRRNLATQNLEVRQSV